MDNNINFDSSQVWHNMQLYVVDNNDGVDDMINNNYRNDFDSFPSGIRFKPKDTELIVYYLMKKIYDLPLPPNRFPEEDILKYTPEQLAKKYRPANEYEWYVFSSQTRKYPKGTRPDRSAGNGFWKPTGKDISIKNKGRVIGFKKNLEFHIGHQPHGERTDWKMHEYRLVEQFIPEDKRTRDGCDQLNSWILCKIYNKKYNVEDVEISSGEESSATSTSPAAPSQQDAINITSYGILENGSFGHNGFGSVTNGVAQAHNRSDILHGDVPPLMSHFSAETSQQNITNRGGSVNEYLNSNNSVFNINGAVHHGHFNDWLYDNSETSQYNALANEYLHYSTGINTDEVIRHDTFPNGTSINNYSNSPVPLAMIPPSQPSFNENDNLSSQAAPIVEPDLSIPHYQNSFAGQSNWSNSSNFLLENSPLISMWNLD